MPGLTQEIRHTLRSLARTPGVSLPAVATLAVGIGAGTAVFSAVNALLVRPLPVRDADRLVAGLALREGFDPFETSLLEYAAFRQADRSFAGTGLGSRRFFNLTGQGEPERLPGAAVTADYFGTLGVAPALGRGFEAAEDRPGGPAVALIGDGLWRRRFGADAGVIGLPFDLGGRPTVILGVMPPGFDLPYSAEVWVPLQLDPETLPMDLRAARAYTMIGRLAPGVSARQADAELKGIAARLEKDHPSIRHGWTYRLVPLRRFLIGDLAGRTGRSLWTLSAAVGFLLLICCANVANLLLVRGVAREREIAVRLALGAGAGRVSRQLLGESLCLAAAGGAAGVGVAFVIMPLLGRLSPIQAFSFAAQFGDFHLDARVLAAALVLSMLAGAIAGLLPALRVARRRDLASALGQREQRGAGGVAGRRWLAALVVGEIAVAATLLTGGALVVRSFQRLQSAPLGFRPGGLLKVELPLADERAANPAGAVAFLDRVLERIRALPGVVGAGAASNVPLQEASVDSLFTVEGRPAANPADVPITAHRLVSAGYLQTLGATLLEGRWLEAQDRAGSRPVVVVSRELARRAWPGEDALGRRIRRGRSDQTIYSWLTVVGVVDDVKEDRFNFRIARPAWYMPYDQLEGNLPPGVPANLLVRTSGEPAGVAAAVREAIRSVDPDQPVTGVLSMTEHKAGVLLTERSSAVLMGMLAAIGLALAALGLYGVMAYTVSQRTGEIGLRMALGARPGDVVRSVLGRGLLLIGAGLAAGLLGGGALARLLAGSLYEVGPGDPTSFAVVALLLAGVALVACWLPARRAARIDPMAALRWE